MYAALMNPLDITPKISLLRNGVPCVV